MNTSSKLIGLAAIAVNLGLLVPVASHAEEFGGELNRENRAIAAVRQLPDADLKVFYLRCARAALQQSLSGTEIALCSHGYDELVSRTFKGDFDRFLAWSQSHPEYTTELALASK